MRHAGATGQLTVRADSSFYTHSIVALFRRMDVRFSITVRQHKSRDMSGSRRRWCRTEWAVENAFGGLWKLRTEYNCSYRWQ